MQKGDTYYANRAYFKKYSCNKKHLSNIIKFSNFEKRFHFCPEFSLCQVFQMKETTGSDNCEMLANCLAIYHTRIYLKLKFVLIDMLFP